MCTEGGGAWKPPDTLSTRRDLVLVSAGFEPDGGGRAAVGRLLRRVCEEYAASRNVGLEILCLRGTHAKTERARSYGGATGALALAVARRHLGRKRAYVYDLLGLARTEAILPRALRGPYLLMLLGVEVWRPLSRTRRIALREACCRLAISRHTLAQARRYTPDVEAEILPLTLDDEPSAGGTPDAGVLARAGTGFLLMVGRMSSRERYKGHDDVLAALSRVVAEHPSARLVVAGEGDDRARLEARASELGVAEHVVFTGFVSDATLRRLYADCAALVLPSRGEGFGLVYLEAMRAGRACVALRDSAAEEIVIDGETGWLVSPGEADELAAACLAALSSDISSRRGAAGRDRWRSAFGYDRYRDGMFMHLDGLTGQDVRH
jgi:phosphatidylinositol alpha-1,6-mannosyltransferase